MSDIAKIFGWSHWPFHIVADIESADIWSDRAALKLEIERRLRRLQSIEHSTIQLLWADFGAGKSHSLRFIQGRCKAASPAGFIPIYTEVPVGTNGLLDIYRRFTAELPDEVLLALSATIQSGKTFAPASLGARDLRQALRVITQPHSKSLILDWIHAPGGFPNLRDLKAIGISSRIEDDLRAVEVLSDIIALISKTHPASGVVWLVDEFQRIADIQPRKRDSFAKSIVSLFNACPRGLHLILSFSVAQQSTALGLLPPDLKSRAATFPMLALPHLSSEDAIIFCRDLFSAFRIVPDTRADFPFTPDALSAVVESLVEATSGSITPRLLIERVESVLFEAYDAFGDALVLPIDSPPSHSRAPMSAD